MFGRVQSAPATIVRRFTVILAPGARSPSGGPRTTLRSANAVVDVARRALELGSSSKTWGAGLNGYDASAAVDGIAAASKPRAK